jgi:hypothetical protein
MLLTRLAFWYLPNPRFTRYLGGFGPKLVPSLIVQAHAFREWIGRVDVRCLAFLDESGANLAMGRSHVWCLWDEANSPGPFR